MNEGYPKLQWSIFVKNGKDQQYVVRADTVEEFKELKTFVLAQVGEQLVDEGRNVSSVAKSEEYTPAENTPKCALHGIPMKQRTAKHGGTYYDHRRKNENEVWEQCSGAGWHS